MIGKPVALLQIPNQRLFSLKAAARYLGVHEQTLRTLTDTGQVPALRRGARRVYRLDDLDRYIDSLPQWYDGPGEECGTERRRHGD